MCEKIELVKEIVDIVSVVMRNLDIELKISLICGGIDGV